MFILMMNHLEEFLLDLLFIFFCLCSIPICVCVGLFETLTEIQGWNITQLHNYVFFIENNETARKAAVTKSDGDFMNMVLQWWYLAAYSPKSNL